MPKRKCAFTNDLKREYPYLKEAVNDKVHCNQCMAVFSISHDGRSDINKPKNTSPPLFCIVNVNSFLFFDLKPIFR